MKLFKKDRVFYSNVLSLAIPIAFQSAITVGVNMLDNYMVSNVSQDSLSAVSLANTFISIFQIFCMGLGMGASVLVSRYWGMMKKNDHYEESSHALKQTISLMLRLTLLFAAIFAAITYLAPDKIMRSYSDEDTIINEGIAYFKYSVVTYFFVGVSMVSAIVLRSVGQARIPLFISILALLINLLGNYMFIFGNLGMPRLGVSGAALGTLISRIVEFTIILIYIFKIDKKIQFKVKHLFMNVRSILGEYINICIPVLVSDAILAFGNNSVAMVIGHLGGNFVAANAITANTQQLSTVVIQGVSQAGAIVTGQTLGMGQKEKTMEQGYLFLGLGLALGYISAWFIMISHIFVIDKFNPEPEAFYIAAQLMMAISIILIFQAANSIMTKGVLRGGGDTKMLMLADNIFLWIFALPLGIVTGFILHLPPFFIYLSLKSDQILKTIWCVFRLKSGKWIKKIGTGKESNT